MTKNLETRQNDFVETSQNSGGGDLLREMYRDFKKLVKKGTETYKQNKNEKDQKRQREEQEKNQEKQRKNQEKQTKREQEKYDNTERINEGSGQLARGKYSEEIKQDLNDITKLLDDINKLGGDREIGYSVDVINTYSSDSTKAKQITHTIHGSHYELEIVEYYTTIVEKNKIKKFNVYHINSIKVTDPDNVEPDIVLRDPSVGDYHRAIDLIKADCAKKKQETQDRNARAMKKAIAQNHDDYHENVEVKQADADLEAQLNLV